MSHPAVKGPKPHSENTLTHYNSSLMVTKVRRGGMMTTSRARTAKSADKTQPSRDSADGGLIFEPSARVGFASCADERQERLSNSAQPQNRGQKPFHNQTDRNRRRSEASEEAKRHTCGRHVTLAASSDVLLILLHLINIVNIHSFTSPIAPRR